MTNSIVWDLKKIREMKSDTIFVLKSMKKTRQIAMLRGTNVKLAPAWSRNIKIGARLIERGTK